jgi:hypothetical protein
MGNEDIIYGNQGQPSASSRMVLDSSKERKEKGEPLISRQTHRNQVKWNERLIVSRFL